MMKKSMAKASPSPPQFTPIEEGNEDEDYSQERMSFRATPPPPASDKRDVDSSHHHPTPLHSDVEKQEGNKHEVSWNKCRPCNRDKLSAVPALSMASPNGLFKSVLSSLAPKRSPRPPEDASREDHWKIVAAELSNRLVQATKKRNEAILESSKLKYSMAELEKKLNKLEIYCHTFKSATTTSSYNNCQLITVGGYRERVVEHFLVSVSEARSTVRILGRALSLQMRHAGGKVYDRIATLSQPYDLSISFSRTPRGLLYFLEALLNRALFEDFESAGFRKGGHTPVLNPVDRCESNFAMFSRLQGLTWDEVLNKGTRHFSVEFSKFIDGKMSEVVGMLGWNRAWPEPLLQAFFGASKAVWLVHLLANSVHPGLPIFRVDNGAGFDPVYMEDMGGDKARSRRLVPGIVRMMVAPGFYVYDSVVKCKVLCRYYNSYHNPNGGNEFYHDKGFVPSPSPS